MENILEECGCYPAWMLIHAGNAIKNYYADTRHAEAESCRGYEITCYKKILGRMSNYTTITSPEGEEMPCLPACNDQLMAVGVQCNPFNTILCLPKSSFTADPKLYFQTENNDNDNLSLPQGDNNIVVLPSSSSFPRAQRLLRPAREASAAVQQCRREPRDHCLLPEHLQGRPCHAG